MCALTSNRQIIRERKKGKKKEEQSYSQLIVSVIEQYKYILLDL